MRVVILTCMSGILIFNLGCMKAAGRAFTEAKGAGAKAAAVPGLSTAQLRKYKGVSVGTPRSDLGSLVHPTFASTLRGAVIDKLTTSKDPDKPPIFSGGSPTLEIDPHIMFYMRPGSLGGILGSDSYAVVLFWLKDEGGADIGRVQVVTKSGASRTEPDDLARAAADGLADFFKKHRKHD